MLLRQSKPLPLRLIAVSLTVFCQDAAYACDEHDPACIVMKRPLPQGAASVQIEGGSKQDVNNWRATVKFLLYGKDLYCTSTIVGQHAIITAAHCISDRAKYAIQFGDAPPIDVSCERHSKFVREGLLNDVAMCFSEPVLPNLGGYENIDASSRVPVNTPLFLLGYGCRNLNTLKDPGQLYGGSSYVKILPTSSNDHLYTKGGVLICPGDSGGAAYRLTVADKPVNPRSIVGLGSSSDPSNRTSGITTFSQPVLDFINNWKKGKGPICGLDVGAVGCHDRFAL